MACHRSGSTLTRYLLDAHPRIACPPESKFVAGLRKCVDYPQVLRALQSLGVSQRDFVSRLGDVTRGIMDDYARSRGKARWVDKTPNYVAHLDFIDEMFDANVSYLIQVRHPLDNVASLEDAIYFQDDRLEDPDIKNAVARFGRGRLGWARHWCEVNATLLRWADKARGRAHILRYEDLVMQPLATLEPALDSLGEKIAPEMLSTAFAPRSSGGFGDWKIRCTRAVHSESLDRWRLWPESDREDVWEIVGNVAASFGYFRPPSALEGGGEGTEIMGGPTQPFRRSRRATSGPSVSCHT